MPTIDPMGNSSLNPDHEDKVTLQRGTNVVVNENVVNQTHVTRITNQNYIWARRTNHVMTSIKTIICKKAPSKNYNFLKLYINLQKNFQIYKPIYTIL